MKDFATVDMRLGNKHSINLDALKDNLKYVGSGLILVLGFVGLYLVGCLL